MNKIAVLSDFQKLLGASDVMADAPLARFCTWKIGGPADILVSPAAVEDVVLVTQYARQNALPLVVIGGGSNILFDDAGFRGIILRIGSGLAGFEMNADGFVRAGAGIWTPAFVRRVAGAGFAGCSHAIGIPGSLGGLVVMNGGTFRKGIGEQLVEATIVRKDGSIGTLTHQECAFGVSFVAATETGIRCCGCNFSIRAWQQGGTAA